MSEVLVATDFSDSGDSAVHVAVQYARVLRGRLHLLHVLSADEVEVTRLLADAAAQAGPDVPVTMSAPHGDPADEILRYADRHAIDLIVVGTHGRTGFSRMLLGSVAERVVRGAARPVLVVPAPPAPAKPAEAAAVEDRVPSPPGARACLVCATPTPDLICAPCRARIRGEALLRKQHEEPPGRS